MATNPAPPSGSGETVRFRRANARARGRTVRSRVAVVQPLRPHQRQPTRSGPAPFSTSRKCTISLPPVSEDRPTSSSPPTRARSRRCPRRPAWRPRESSRARARRAAAPRARERRAQGSGDGASDRDRDRDRDPRRSTATSSPLPGAFTSSSRIPPPDSPVDAAVPGSGTTAAGTTTTTGTTTTAETVTTSPPNVAAALDALSRPLSRRAPGDAGGVVYTSSSASLARAPSHLAEETRRALTDDVFRRVQAMMLRQQFDFESQLMELHRVSATHRAATRGGSPTGNGQVFARRR